MNKQKIKRLLAKFYPPIYKSGILILNYHSVGANNHYSLPVKEFECQMRYLADNYKTVSLKKINNFEELNGLSVVITFDDGYEDNFLNAYPILKKYNLPATIFLTSDFILNGVDIAKNWPDYKGLRPLQIEQVKEMDISNVINFGSHGKTHRRIAELSKDEFEIELSESKKQIESLLIHSITDYAFPFGQKRDRKEDVDDLFKQRGYATVCTTDWGINLLEDLNLYGLKRIRIDHNDSIDDFINKIKGNWDFIGLFQSIKNLCKKFCF